MKLSIILVSLIFPFLSISQNIVNAIELSQKGEYSESNKILDKIKIISSHDKPKIYYYIAENDYYLGNLDSSIYFVTLSLKYNLNENELKSKSYSLLGAIYSDIGEINLSESFYFKSLKIRKKENDLLGVAKCNNNLGDLYFSQSKYKKSIIFFNNALRFFRKKTDLNHQITLSNIGAAYIQLKKPNEALKFIKEANKIAISLQDSLGQSICINNLATIYRDLHKADSALFYYNEALRMVDSLGSKEEKKKILLNLAELYEKKGNIKLAFYYFKKYTSLKDELFNKEKNEFIVETQEKYQATKRLKDLAELKVKVQQKEATQKQFIFWFTIIAIIVLVVFGSVLAWMRWKSLQQKNRAKLEIITATMYGEEKQRLKISQELHDDLGGLLGVCRMLFTKSKQFFVEQNKDLFERIDSLLVQANTRSRTISHELFSPTLKQFGLQSAIQEHIINLQFLNPDLEIKFSMNDFRLNEQLELNCFRISQELLTNTIKYANAFSISLRLELENDKLIYTYSDNGIGFDPLKVTKGVGLSSIEARVKSFDGKIQYNPINQGFEIKIIIPLKKI